MSNLNVEQKSIFELFSNYKSDFLIPDYQRKYEWGDEQCSQLWDDLYSFCIPDDDYTKFDRMKNEYYLGSIVTFRNENAQFEVIDGQQRLTTLILLMRAFWSLFSKTKDSNSNVIRENLGKCIWKCDEFNNILPDKMKIESQVISDNDKQEFEYILKNGNTLPQHKSKYAENYRFFMEKIENFIKQAPAYVSYLPARIMPNCIILHIIGENIDTALRIFSNLNDRGLSLSDADIFKAQLYKFYSSINKRDTFINEWKQYEYDCQSIYKKDDAEFLNIQFVYDMFYERAKRKITNTTTEGLRKFFERNNYELLKKEDTWINIKNLTQFIKDIEDQNIDRFDLSTLKRLFVLSYAPNQMGNLLITVYFLAKMNIDGYIDKDDFNRFLEKITAFIWAYACLGKAVSTFRTPVYPEMVKIIEGKEVDFSNYRINKIELRSRLNDTKFGNTKRLTRSMLVWWAFYNFDQHLLDINTPFEIEHIYAKNRYKKEGGLSDENIIDMLGNKSILEKTVNIRASDYRFVDKKKYYKGYKGGTNICELLQLTRKEDFREKDIIERDCLMKEKFMAWVGKNDLLL